MREFNINNLKIYHVFHIIVNPDNDEPIAIFNHSQANWDYYKNKKGLWFDIPTSIFDDFFTHNCEKIKTVKELLNYVVVKGCFQSTIIK